MIDTRTFHAACLAPWNPLTSNCFTAALHALPEPLCARLLAWWSTLPEARRACLAEHGPSVAEWAYVMGAHGLAVVEHTEITSLALARLPGARVMHVGVATGANFWLRSPRGILRTKRNVVVSNACLPSPPPSLL
jgi:hypothetical protein